MNAHAPAMCGGGERLFCWLGRNKKKYSALYNSVTGI